VSHPIVLETEKLKMLYTNLCYHNEEITSSWTEEEDAAVIECLKAVNRKWAKNFKPIVRLMPTSAATTLRKAENIITDGPFAETKEQLLGFYVVNVESLDVRSRLRARWPRPIPVGRMSCARSRSTTRMERQ
jgi:hypothetical protein